IGSVSRRSTRRRDRIGVCGCRCWVPAVVKGAGKTGIVVAWDGRGTAGGVLGGGVVGNVYARFDHVVAVLDGLACDSVFDQRMICVIEVRGRGSAQSSHVADCAPIIFG